MEKLLSTILKLLESKHIPKVLVHFLVVAAIIWILSQAGLPIVDYTEKALVKLQEYPKLAGGLFGGSVSVLWIPVYRPLYRAIITRIRPENFALQICILFLLGCLYLSSVLLTIGFVAWAVS